MALYRIIWHILDNLPFSNLRSSVIGYNLSFFGASISLESFLEPSAYLRVLQKRIQKIRIWCWSWSNHYSYNATAATQAQLCILLLIKSRVVSYYGKSRLYKLLHKIVYRRILNALWHYYHLLALDVFSTYLHKDKTTHYICPICESPNLLQVW